MRATLPDSRTGSWIRTDMYRVFGLCLALIIFAPFTTQAPPAATEQSAPSRDVPLPLQQVWLRFHEEELCQGVDAEFAFNKDGLEVHCLVEDEKSYDKFQEMLEPLRSSYKIDLVAERPPVGKDPDEPKTPPASLWENYELRSFLGDPFARARERPGSENRNDLPPPPPDDILKQQLIVYSEQTLDWNKKMERYAADLPALADVAFGSSSAPELRPRASAICRAHAQALGRYLGRLTANLAEALPKGDKKDRSHPKSASSAGSNGLASGAEEISETARDIAQRVYAFIHPETYTVGLDELRQPSLLDSLRNLQKTNSEFLKSIDKANLHH
jgi:hypothetical protein